MKEELQCFDREELYGDENGNGRSIRVVTRNPLLFGPKSHARVKFIAGIRNRDLTKIGTLLSRGKSNRAISRETGSSEKRVRRIRKALEGERAKPFICACGRPAGHRPYCPVIAVKDRRFKLDPDKVRYIRTHYIPRKVGCEQLGKKFGVDPEIIRSALTGKTWAHVEDPGPLPGYLARRANKKKRTLILRLLKRGWSGRRIAKKVGVNKERVYQLARLSIPTTAENQTYETNRPHTQTTSRSTNLRALGVRHRNRRPGSSTQSPVRLSAAGGRSKRRLQLHQHSVR